MDWDFVLSDYFKLSLEERENYIFFITKYYVDLMVNKDDKILFVVTINELIKKVRKEWRISEREERYEEAEIFRSMFKELVKIKKQFENVSVQE